MNIFEKLSEIYKIPPGQIKDEIRRAVARGYENEDEQVRRRWAALFPGGKPTPEEFITVMATRLILGEE